ncbi:MAG TPA: ABC transporter ATP-binding protein [Candidatus Ozemobacteraceae bacterium]|nr:ABC transporter ATP-binding protein [Candidatus Ozemobacteraceae bacterium]
MPLETSAPAVEVESLVKRFGEFVAVNALSFTVAPGEVFGFLGPNGAGKSTTIRMLCGLLIPDGGRGSVGGFDIATQAEQIKANIGYMSQRFSLYDDLTVEENLDLYAGIYGVPADIRPARKARAVGMAGLERHRRSLARDLAGGWKQRLALGCAVLHAPRILFLDEPTSGVDPLSRRRFWDLIAEFAADGVTVFVTTHYMDEAEYCDRLALIYHGDMIAHGPPARLKADHAGNLHELRCERLEEALELFSGWPEARDPALFGATIHFTPAGDTPAATLVAKLRAAGIDDAAITPIRPTLEDVFVELIEADNRSRARNGAV